MTATNSSRLLKLGETDLTIRSPLEDVRGRMVIDQSGDEIGHVDALLIDDQERKVRFLRIASGGILGVGEQRFLVPVDAVLGMDDNQLVIDQTVNTSPARQAMTLTSSTIATTTTTSIATTGTPRFGHRATPIPPSRARSGDWPPGRDY